MLQIWCTERLPQNKSCSPTTTLKIPLSPTCSRDPLFCCRFRPPPTLPCCIHVGFACQEPRAAVSPKNLGRIGATSLRPPHCRRPPSHPLHLLGCRGLAPNRCPFPLPHFLGCHGMSPHCRSESAAGYRGVRMQSSGRF
jgi:hypothetical protein